jgi:plastocyanin
MRRSIAATRILVIVAGVLIAAAGGVSLVVSLAWAGRVPGGGVSTSDCYLELEVQGVDPPQVSNGRNVACTDGDACDADGQCGNDSCTFAVAVCINQADPNLACTPPSALRRLRVSRRLRAVQPASLAGSACGGFVQLPVAVRVRGNGSKLPGKLALLGNAVAVKGSRPARDRDKVVLQCVPSPGCPGVAPTTTTTLPGAAATVSVGPGGGFSFDPVTVNIRVGETVRWRFASAGHNVVSGSGGNANGMFCSPDDTGCANAPLGAPGSTYEHTFSEPGTYPYFCTPHFAFGMTGRVIVEP